jgi:hypothetical protein
MLTGLVIVAIVLVMMGSLYLSGRFATAAKHESRCIACMSQEIHLAVRSALSNAGIYYSDMLWSPSQSSYNQVGSAQRTPKEIWINESDVERAKGIIESQLNYRIETTETALIVHTKE